MPVACDVAADVDLSIRGSAVTLNTNGDWVLSKSVARLTRIAGIKAQIDYKRRPGIYGGRPSVVVDNTLNRQFNVTAPDKAWVTGIT